MSLSVFPVSATKVVCANIYTRYVADLPLQIENLSDLSYLRIGVHGGQQGGGAREDIIF